MKTLRREKGNLLNIKFIQKQITKQRLYLSHMKNPIPFLIILFITLNGFSQHNKCATHTHWKERVKADPNLRIKKSEIEDYTQQYIHDIATGRRKKSNTEITIPVVVHVLFHKDLENISDEQIESQIDVLNEDFNNENSDAITIEDENFAFYNELSLGSNIRFELANFDPDGNPTTGITRTYTNTESFNFGSEDLYFTSEGGKDNWDPTQYLNIWVIALEEDDMTLGWAYSPAGLTDFHYSDGVVLRHDVFGTIGTVSFQTNKLGRTGTHEVGHWLNLSHIWGDTADDDPTCASDFVEDTPPAETAHYGCPIYPNNVNNSCGSDERGEMFMNYMDYVNDECMYLFTQGQSVRMRAAIEGPRSGLLNSIGLVGKDITATTSIDEFNSLSIYPNPSVSGHFSVKSDDSFEFITISDSYGRIILKQSVNDTSYDFDLNNYSNGIYYLELKANRFSTTQKIIKQ